MSVVSLVPIVVIFCIALGSLYLILRITKVDVPKDKFVSIDGLRGILAFSVFLHHSCIWYYYLRTDDWMAPPSNVYAHFGATSVAMFFMITAFLFFTKLLDARTRGIDWVKLYASRIYRIMPLYLFAILLVFLIVGILSRFRLDKDMFHLSAQFLKWLFFIDVDVNRVPGTKRIVAGVVWTLAYEWLFYCGLAIIGRAIYRIKASPATLVISGMFLLVFAGIIYKFYPDDVIKRLIPFSGGILAAYLVKKPRIVEFCSQRWVALLVIAAMVAAFQYPHLGAPIPFLCVCAAFLLIAAGNNVFGLLTHRLTRFLGTISYSLYLLHGIILFVCFNFVLGSTRAKTLSTLGHWLTIAGCAVVLPVICTLTYFYIEKAAQRKKSGAARELRKAMG